MLKTTSLALIVALASAPAAFAGGHDNGNNDAAASMVANIKAYGGGLAKQLSPQGVATADPGDRGWGNAGSRLTGNGVVDGLLKTDIGTDGAQVSKRNK